MNTGGPAYPQHGWTRDPEVLERMKNQGGMTLLDWMAGQALAGYVANNGVSGNFDKHAEQCYDLASAMLTEKARREADHSEDKLGNVAEINRELVEALEACESAFSKFAPQEESAYGTAWIKVRAVLSKAKGIA